MPKVLLVEDDAAVQRVLERTLQKLGHEVTLAVNGAKALELLDTQSFDLMITDLIMPEMEGLQLLRELRKKPARPTVIAMSGGGRGSATDYLEIAKTFGATVTLPKPFSQEQLTAAIDRALTTA